MRRVLITGGAGFIGTHLATRLLDAGDSVVVLDCFDPFYDPAIKRRNVAGLRARGGDRFELLEGDIREPEACRAAVEDVDGVMHLAALAGVRPSLEDPVRYMDVNVRGTQVLLNAVRDAAARKPIRFLFGSSSSVYGGNVKVPFAESDPVEHPVSPYAASKRAGELICYTFHHLTGIPVTCLRFFTVFGPGQRPEMAIHKFSRMIVDGKPVPMFGDGTTSRDYTFVSDIVDGLVAALERADGYRIYNLGGSRTTTLAELIRGIEQALGRTAVIERLPEQPGDVKTTNADLTLVERELGFMPKVSMAEGLRQFAAWYLAEREAGRVS
ncbi:MAG: SDR family NAD(P)-dependent oxidoreductase [Planctomycetes bacterium]|nr:SDR family NAD(P)-dependent oxidoreductase [Planctomycetota bacterium]MCB9869481.1 SDR family NAD(P)-dependent oxidoreductase [Planctomycetota bacterium]